MFAPNKEVNLLLVIVKSHLNVYAEQGRNLLLAFISFQNISKYMPNKEVCLLLAFVSSQNLIIMPNKEVSLLLALVPNKVVSLLLDDQ